MSAVEGEDSALIALVVILRREFGQGKSRNIAPSNGRHLYSDAAGRHCEVIVSHWHLEPIEKYVRETAEFVNLYSQSREAYR